MVTIYFYKFPQEEQHKYLEYLESENGVEEFVNDKIMEIYGDKYKVIFVPGTVFELGVLNSFAEDVLNSTVIPSGPDENSQSIFPAGDLRNAYYVFTKLKLDLAERIIGGLNKFAHGDNAAIQATEYAYGEYALHLNCTPSLGPICLLFKR